MSTPTSIPPPIQLGNVGTALGVTVRENVVDGDVVDVSGASSKTIYLRKPDRSLLTKSASFTTDGEDGQIEWVTVAGDLDQPGEWEIQGRVVIGGAPRSSAIGKFFVARNLPEGLP